MQSSLSLRLAALVAAVTLAAAGGLQALAAGPVTVTVNGGTVALSPPPVERAGRVFVPLRGVFENLGASVVYASGVINATGRGHTISLKIGSQQATVDGQQQALDVAPFIIGASTYVPLRFVSQALGATVNYDGANNLVAINTGGNQTAPAPQNVTITPAPGTAGEWGSIKLDKIVPQRGASITSAQPTIQATFSGNTADPNKMKVTLDDLDVTGDTSRNPHGFSYAPRSPLQAGKHVVQVSGVDSNGKTFSRGWDFTTP